MTAIKGLALVTAMWLLCVAMAATVAGILQTLTYVVEHS